jgi:hypothetical protein
MIGGLEGGLSFSFHHPKESPLAFVKQANDGDDAG